MSAPAARKREPIRLWTKDWLQDEQLARCSWEAKGLWIDLLCLMQDSPTRGELRDEDNAPMTPRDIAKKMRRQTPQVMRLLGELLKNGVASRYEWASGTPNPELLRYPTEVPTSGTHLKSAELPQLDPFLDTQPVYYSRRMVRDAYRAEMASQFGKEGVRRKKDKPTRDTHKGHPQGDQKPPSSISSIKPLPLTDLAQGSGGKKLNGSSHPLPAQRETSVIADCEHLLEHLGSHTGIDVRMFNRPDSLFRSALERGWTRQNIQDALTFIAEQGHPSVKGGSITAIAKAAIDRCFHCRTSGEPIYVNARTWDRETLNIQLLVHLGSGLTKENFRPYEIPWASWDAQGKGKIPGTEGSRYSENDVQMALESVGYQWVRGKVTKRESK